MHVLIATLGTRGDVQPLLALALGLRDRGHQVRFCGPTDEGNAIEARGLEFVDLGVDARRYLKEHPEVVAGKSTAFFTIKRHIRQLLDNQFSVLEGALEGIDLVVGAGVVSAPSSVAEAKRLPYRAVALTPIAIPSRQHPPYLFPVMGLPRFANAALWQVNELLVSLLVAATLDRHRKRLGLAPVRPVSNILTPPGKVLLAVDPEVTPPPSDYVWPLIVTGALRLPLDPGAVLPPALTAFIDAGTPPVYIGFGSMTDPDAAATTRTIIDAVERAGVRAVLGSGWAGLGGSLPACCMAVGETSHDLLFPRMAGIVHHGGAGTTASAARAGVPQLIVPHIMDQFYTARCVERAGIAPRSLPRRALNADVLASRLRALTSEPALRERARELAGRLRSRDGVAAAVAALEAAVHTR